MDNHNIDAALEFLHRKSDGQNIVSTAVDSHEEEDTHLPFNTSKLFTPGLKVGLSVLLRQEWQIGRLGRAVKRDYILRCLAPTGEGGAECGKEFGVNYQQLYQGSVYTCGCMQPVRRPHQRLDNYKTGTLTVLGYNEERRLWAAVCSICRNTVYRKTRSKLDAISDNCAPHFTEGEVTQ